jgi:hypothetical protein
LGALVAVLLHADPFSNPDSRAFEGIARALLSGQGFVYREPMFPSLPMYAFRSPGYSAFLAMGLLLGGVTAAVALQGALNGVAAGLVGDLAGRWAGTAGPGRGAGTPWIAFALRLAWPAGWFYAGQFLSETLFEFALVLTIWLAVKAGGRRSLAWAVAAGLAASLAVLTRPTGLGPVAVAAVWLAIRFPRGAVALVIAAVVAWAPWPIRNYARLHAFVPFQTMGGVALYDSHSDQDPIVAWTYMAEHTELGEVGFDRHFSRTALELIRRNPGRALRRVTRAALDYAGPIFDRRRDTWLHRFALLAVLPALAWADWRRRLALPAAVWASFGVLIVPIVVNLRYRFPAEWCVVTAAAIGLTALAAHVGWKRTAAWAALGLAASIAFTLAIGRA